MNPERDLRVFCCPEFGLRFEDVYSELRPAKALRFSFCDLISFGFADDVIDDNGAKHDKLGRFEASGHSGSTSKDARRGNKRRSLPVRASSNTAQDSLELKKAKEKIGEDPDLEGMDPLRAGDSEYFKEKRNSRLSPDRAKAASKYGRILLKSGVNPAKAVRLAFREGQGCINTKIEGKRTRILIDQDACKETGRNFFPENIAGNRYKSLKGGGKRQIAETYLSILENLPALIEKGEKEFWKEPHKGNNHHVGEEKLTIRSSFKGANGKSRKVFIDLFRDKTNRSKVWVHNVTSEGFKTYHARANVEGVAKRSSKVTVKRKRAKDEETVTNWVIAGIRFA